MQKEQNNWWLSLSTVAVFAMYLLFPTSLYFWDGMLFSIKIEDPAASAISLLHPNHLFYNLIGYAAWKGLNAAGFALRAITVLQGLSAFFAAATFYFLWKTIQAKTRSTAWSAVCSLLFAFSATWWRYATDADAYILSIFFLVVAYWLMTAVPCSRPFTVGLAHSAAMLIHQLALFFLPVALLGIYFGRDRSGSARQRFMATVEYGATSVIATAIGYISAFLALANPHATMNEFWQWVTTHQNDVPFFSINFLRNASLTLRSIVRLFFGGKFSLARADWATIVVGIVSILVIITLLLQIFRKSPPNKAADDLDNPRRRWIEANWLPLLWAFSYIIFLFFGRPQDTFHWLFCLPALILLIAGIAGASPSGIASKWMAVFFMLLFSANFVFYISPYSRPENNAILSFALNWRQHWSPGTTIIYSKFHSDLWTISYFNPQARWIGMSNAAPAAIENQMAEAKKNGCALWLEKNVYEDIRKSPGGPEWLERNIDGSHSLKEETRKYSLAFYPLPGTPSRSQ